MTQHLRVSVGTSKKWASSWPPSKTSSQTPSRPPQLADVSPAADYADYTDYASKNTHFREIRVIRGKVPQRSHSYKSGVHRTRARHGHFKEAFVLLAHFSSADLDTV